MAILAAVSCEDHPMTAHSTKSSLLSIMPLLAGLFFIGGCQPFAWTSLAPVDRTFENLREWPGLRQPQHKLLSDDIGRLRWDEFPADAVLTKAGETADNILIVHVGWTVAICYVGHDLAVQEVLSFPAKSGFTLCFYRGLVVVLNEHPGTDMFYKRVLRVGIEHSKLTATEVSGQERKEILDYLTRESPPAPQR